VTGSDALRCPGTRFETRSLHEQPQRVALVGRRGRGQQMLGLDFRRRGGPDHPHLGRRRDHDAPSPASCVGIREPRDEVVLDAPLLRIRKADKQDPVMCAGRKSPGVREVEVLSDEERPSDWAACQPASSGCPTRPSSRTVSTSYPRVHKSGAAVTGRFSSSLSFMRLWCRKAAAAERAGLRPRQQRRKR
jgi:hypothetical protein